MSGKFLWTGLFIYIALNSLFVVSIAPLLGAIVMGIGVVLAWFGK